eukprot:gene8053-10072_t
MEINVVFVLVVEFMLRFKTSYNLYFYVTVKVVFVAKCTYINCTWLYYFDKFDAVDVRKYYTTIIQDPFITLGLVHDN